MQNVAAEKQDQQAEPLDDATKAAVEIGRAQLRRGEGITSDQVKINVRNRIKAWRKTQEEVRAA